MQITIAPASSQICRAAVEALLADKSQPKVIGIYRNLNKVPAEFRDHPNFTAKYGDLTDLATLNFTGSDALLVMSPPKYDGSDYVSWARSISYNTLETVKKSGSLRRLVYISSMGAQHAQGVGEVRTNHTCEQLLKDAAPEVVFVRNGYFMQNWSSAIPTIKADPPYFYSTLTPVDYKIPMVSTRDIGITCASELLATGSPVMTNPSIIYQEGPQWYSTSDVHRAFEEVTGKSIELRLVPKDQLSKFFAGFLPASIVDDFVEMSLSFLPGGIQEEEMKGLNARHGQDTLAIAFKRMLNSE